MKRFFSIFAVAAAMVVAVCAVSSCKKDDAKSSDPLVGEWVYEDTIQSPTMGAVARKVVYTFAKGDYVSCAGYYNGNISDGNGGTYSRSGSTVTINFTIPECTETGTLNGDELTINTTYYGTCTFTKSK